MKRAFLAILFAFSLMTLNVTAQELNFTVQINTAQVSGTDQRLYESLKESMVTFMNQRIWTNIKFEENERIEGSMVLVVKNRDGNSIDGELNVVLRRPVYKSNYNSPLLNIVDNDISFSYIDGQPLDFNENSFMSNLTSILAYYGYYCLGIYFDTFGQNGGDEMFNMCDQIVTQAQNAAEGGWKAFDSYKNRYWLLDSYTNPAYRSLRQFMYEYHRLGLDVMGSGKIENGRTTITKSLDYVKTAYTSKSNLYFIQILNDSKRDEWKNIYSDGPQQEKTKAINILRDIDPAHSEEYEEVLNAKKRF
ncbi:MAG: DUF4835 family protein [Bacteroidales bacterium]|nr:DUF4835 family protein [Bacteroidales bacterium]MBR6091818.1 DUF4835 family protein [Bacteroidales bacterium]